MPVSCEFDGIGKQVLQDLLQALVVAFHESRQVGREMDVEWKIFCFGDVPEVAFDIFPQPVECDFLDLDRDGAGLDLGEVENVVDEIEQIGAGRIDISRELDLPVREVARNVLGKLLAENQNRIEWRSQFVGHVGEEFGFVLGRKRKLNSLFLQSVSGLFHLGVLALDFRVLVCEQLRLGTQFLVGLLQFALARLQFDGELLRLREQAFGTHRGLDGIENGARGLG